MGSEVRVQSTTGVCVCVCVCVQQMVNSATISIEECSPMCNVCRANPDRADTRCRDLI